MDVVGPCLLLLLHEEVVGEQAGEWLEEQYANDYDADDLMTVVREDLWVVWSDVDTVSVGTIINSPRPIGASPTDRCRDQSAQGIWRGFARQRGSIRGGGHCGL